MIFFSLKMYVDYEHNYLENREKYNIKYHNVFEIKICYKINKIIGIPTILKKLNIDGHNKIGKIENIPNKLLELHIGGYNTINKIENLNPQLKTLFIKNYNTNHIKLRDKKYRKTQEYLDLIDPRFK